MMPGIPKFRKESHPERAEDKRKRNIQIRNEKIGQ
jgi:hypothetical protein